MALGDGVGPVHDVAIGVGLGCAGSDTVVPAAGSRPTEIEKVWYSCCPSWWAASAVQVTETKPRCLTGFPNDAGHVPCGGQGRGRARDEDSPDEAQ